jgi:hypothetical protein
MNQTDTTQRAAKFQFTSHARPTTYRGVNFRSELEAAWAAFFDLRGIEWEYEPLLQSSWIPDFLIKLKHDDETETYACAEVRPFDCQKQWEAEPNLLEKIRDASPEGRVVILLGVSSWIPTASYIFNCFPQTGQATLEEMSFGDEDSRMSEDWTRARTAVRWHRP